MEAKVDPTEAALAALGGVQERTEQLGDLLRDFLELERRRQQPAVPKTIVLKQTQPIVRDEVAVPSMSIGVLNPSPVVVFIGISGGKASREAQAPSVPPGGGLVLPISAEDLEIGANPADLAAGDAVLYLLRFDTVQPFYFWRA